MTSRRRILGPAAKAIRVANKLAQGAAALQLNCSQGYLSNIEKGAKQPSEIFIRKYADILGVPVDAISYIVAEQVPA